MNINVETPSSPPPVERAFVVSVTIRSFKGRRDVEVHLFRPADASSGSAAGPEASDNEAGPEASAYPWERLLGEPVEPGRDDPEGSRKMVLESFTKDERDRLVEYLKDRYADRLEAIESRALDFPVPLGLAPLSSVPEGKSIGFIRFDAIPNYTLDFPVRGLYDLARHRPLVEEGNE
jgi:hypothetical protein